MPMARPRSVGETTTAATASHLRPSCIDIPPSGLSSREPPNQRGKILHLAFVDLEVGKPVAIALLKEMRNGLLSGHRSLWNWRPSCLAGELSFTVGDHQVVDRLTQFQVCEALPRSFFDPRNLLLQRGVCRVRTLRGYS